MGNKAGGRRWRRLRPGARWRRCLGLLAAVAALGLLAAAQMPAPAVTDPVAQAQDVSVGPLAQLPPLAGMRDFFDLGLFANSGYDTNVTGAPGAGGDAMEELSGSLEAGQQRGPWRWALSYQPSYIAYRHLRGYNRLDQAGQLETSWELNPHWFLRLSEHAAFGRYLSSPAAAQAPGSVLGLNNFVLTPFVRQFSQQPVAELDYIANYRLSFFLRAGYLENRFYGQQAGAGAALSDLEGVAGGAGFRYRLSRRTTAGAELDYDDSRLAGGISHVRMGALLLTLTRVLSPTARVTLFGGPQETQMREDLGLYLSPALLASNPGMAQIHQNGWSWMAGGILTVEAHNTAWSLTASRRATDSGGLFAGAVEADQVLAGLERRWGLAWTARASAGYEYMRLLGVHPALGAAGSYGSAVANLGLDRTLGRRWDLRATYVYLNQTERGLAPVAAVLGRQQVSLGIGYHLRLGQGG